MCAVKVEYPKIIPALVCFCLSIQFSELGTVKGVRFQPPWCCQELGDASRKLDQSWGHKRNINFLKDASVSRCEMQAGERRLCMEKASAPHHQTFRSPLLSTCVQTSIKLLVPFHLKSHCTAPPSPRLSTFLFSRSYLPLPKPYWLYEKVFSSTVGTPTIILK